LSIENLDSFFNPKTIAVIGASERKTSLGGLIFANLMGNYDGQVFPVNEWRQIIQTRKAYPNIKKIPEKIDLAIVATPAHTVPQIIDECGKADVRGIIIVSAGFDESEPTGQRLTKQIIELSKTYGVRILGPNSLGVIRPKNNLYATFGDKKAIPGKIAFISQSAALCGTVLDWSQETKVGLSAVVSVGSMVDVDLSDLIEFFGSDAQTKAIMLYVESIKNVRAFISAARGYARAKPIVIIKAGRFRKTHDIILGHSNRIPEDYLYDAAFKRVGIVRVDTVNELFDCAKALSMQPNPNKPHLTIITNADGPGVLAADQLNLKGGRLAVIGESATLGLKSILPHYCNVSNPIDILEEATPQRFRDVLQICLSDPSGENVLLIYSPQGVTNPHNIAKIVTDLAEETRKTLLVTLMGEDYDCQEARRTLHLHKVPTFKTAEEAVAALMNMYSCTRNLELLYQTPQEVDLTQNNPVYIKEAIWRAFSEGRQTLNLYETLSLLEAYKIPVIKTELATSVKEALAIASKFCYPVVMKSLQEIPDSQKIQRRLSIEVHSASGLKKEFGNISKAAALDFSNIQAVAIQPKQQPECLKFFLGLRKHKKFGPIIIIGKVFEETGVIGDIAVGFPPLNQVLARRLIENAKFAQPHVGALSDSSILEQILVRFSHLILDFPEINEASINPLVVHEDFALAMDGVVTIDRSRVLREVSDREDELVIAPYPKKYISQWILKNGLNVTFRPIKPEDEMRFNELLNNLSQESLRFRFFQVIKEMSHEMLSKNCNVDYDREIAIVSELENGQIIGVVTLILEPNRKRAEYAIMVGDAWQSLGLGSKLMDYIIHVAEDLRVKIIYGIVSSANHKMVSLCGKLGFEAKPMAECTVEMSLTITK
jgi:acetyltransferase